MITIVTYLGEQVVKFIFGGRNSGQSQNEEDTLLSYDVNKQRGQPGARQRDPSLSIWDHELPHLPRRQGCIFARQIRSGRRNRP